MLNKKPSNNHYKRILYILVPSKRNFPNPDDLENGIIRWNEINRPKRKHKGNYKLETEFKEIPFTDNCVAPSEILCAGVLGTQRIIGGSRNFQQRRNF